MLNFNVVLALGVVFLNIERNLFKRSRSWNRLVYALVAILGATVDLGVIWDIADTCNGFMVIPNLIALFILSGTVAKLAKEYVK